MWRLFDVFKGLTWLYVGGVLVLLVVTLIVKI